MNFHEAVDAYMRDQRSAGRINSSRTERTYRSVLELHAEDVSNRSPHLTGREDCKATLARWAKPNTQRTRRSILVSFYDWAVEEGLRPTNPARQTRRPKKQATTVYRLTRGEVVSMMMAAKPGREHTAIMLGFCAGLRNAELRGLQGRHFRRPGYIWVSADIAKGGRERWEPIIGDLAPVVERLRELSDDDYVLHAERWRDPGVNTIRQPLHKRPASAQALYYLVGRVAKRAGIVAHVHPHLMRHAFGDHIVRHAGLRVGQALLGHADVATTEGTYTGRVTLDELTEAVAGFTFLGLPPSTHPVSPVEATTGVEPVTPASRLLEGVSASLVAWIDAQAARVVLYGEHFSQGDSRAARSRLADGRPSLVDEGGRV